MSKYSRLKTLSKAAAAQIVGTIDGMADEEFSALTEKWSRHEVDVPDSKLLDLRNLLVRVFDDSIGSEMVTKRNGYAVDLAVGLALYEELSPANGFSLVSACDDGVWRYLSLVVFPDLTYSRYPDSDGEAKAGGGRLNRKRFYSHTRRIWLKTLWWYVHLSWQGTRRETEQVLAGNGSDTIGQLIERTGNGYRVGLYREIMLQYSRSEIKNASEFKRISKLSLARCRTTEPSLYSGAERGFARSVVGLGEDR